VLSFDGHRGEQLLGLATSKRTAGAKSSEFVDEIPASVRVFGPDGSEIADAANLLSGHALALPAAGTYKFVLQAHLYSLADTGDVTVTIWDAANAPAEARKDRGTTSCDYSLFGSSCDSMSSSSSSGGSLGPAPTSSVGKVEICTTVPADRSCSMTVPTVLVDPNGPPNQGNGTTAVTRTPSTVASGGSGDNSVSSSATTSVPHG
jgi:hypothetical protein